MTAARDEADRELVVAAVLSAAASPRTSGGWLVLVLALLWLVRRGSLVAWAAVCALTGLAAVVHALAALDGGPLPGAAGVALLEAAALAALCAPQVRRLAGGPLAPGGRPGR